MTEIGFNWADWAIVAVVVISTLISLVRGFVKEALSLLTWVAAFVVARLFYPQAAVYVAPYIETPSLQLLAGFGGLFFGMLLIGSIMNWVIVMLVKATGLSGLDRLLGMGFGFARGLLVLVVALALLRMTPAPQDPWYRQSALIPHLELVEGWSRHTFGELYAGLRERYPAVFTAPPIGGPMQRGS